MRFVICICIGARRFAIQAIVGERRNLRRATTRTANSVAGGDGDVRRKIPLVLAEVVLGRVLGDLASTQHSHQI